MGDPAETVTIEISPAMSDLIAAHMRAVEVDERSYGDDCKPLAGGMAAITGAAEVHLFRQVVKAPCVEPEEVQQKLDYIVNGTVGYRTPLLESLLHEEYTLGEDLFSAFVKSLVLPSADDHAASLPDENQGANLHFDQLRKLIELQEEAQEVADLLKALDLIGDGIGGDKGFAISAVALQAKAIADNLSHSLEVLARPLAPAPDTATEEA